MKNVKPTQVLDRNMRPKQIAQFVGCKEVKAYCDTASATKLDLVYLDATASRVLDTHSS
jgi:hypothetical protein